MRNVRVTALQAALLRGKVMALFLLRVWLSNQSGFLTMLSMLRNISMRGKLLLLILPAMSLPPLERALEQAPRGWPRPA